MRRHRLPLLLLAFAASAPAQARTVGTQVSTPAPRSDPFVWQSRPPAPSAYRELRDIRGRIDQARENGDLSAREARRLRRDARLIGRLADRYGRDGLSAAENAELQVRTQVLRGAVGAVR